MGTALELELLRRMADLAEQREDAERTYLRLRHEGAPGVEDARKALFDLKFQLRRLLRDYRTLQGRDRK